MPRREDLYYRLGVVPLELLSLRERLDDIPVLVQNFLEKFRTRYQNAVRGLGRATIGKIRQYPWPGNVRELEFAIERAVILCRGEELRPEDLLLGEDARQAESEPAFPTLTEAKRRHVIESLQRTEWDIEASADLLDVTAAALRRKLEHHGLTEEAKRGDPTLQTG